MFKRSDVKDMYALSPMQQGMLFHAAMDENSTAYFGQTALTIKGDIDLELFKQSFNTVIERYDVLRTVILYEEVKRPMQVVLKERKSSIEYTDISEMDESEQETWIEEFRQADLDKGFDLSKDILMRIAIMKISDEEYRILCSSHHIVMDGWCIGIILKDFFRIYHSLLNGEDAHLDEVPPYSRYIKWLDKQDGDSSLRYWGEYLRGYTMMSGIPEINNCSKTKEYVRKKLTLELNAGLSNKVSSFARKNNVTINSILQGAWGILLQRYNTTNDVVFGSVVSGRPDNLEGIESMVGLFINTVPMRVISNDDMSFIDLVSNIQNDILECQEYSYSTLAGVQSNTSLQGNLLNHIFVYENYPMDKAIGNDDNLALKIVDVESFEQTNYDLNILAYPGEHLCVDFQYNELVYDEYMIEQIKNHYKNILVSCTNDPEIKLSNIRLLTDKERNHIINDLNETNNKYNNENTLQELFEIVVRKNPNKIAVSMNNKEITYQELNSKVNIIANRLRNGNVDNKAIVGIMIDRSVEMIIGILAILKSGAGCLPINPQLPLARIEHMVKDSKASYIITEDKHIEVLSKLDNIGSSQLLNINQELLNNRDESNPKSINNVNDLLYLIYTSGTTGKPKGVMVGQRVINNLVSYCQTKTNINFSDRVLHYSNIGFDVAYQEIYYTLLSSGELCIADEDSKTDMDKLFNIIKRNNIQTVHLPASLVKYIFSDEVYQNDFPSCVKDMMVSGEQLFISDILKRHMTNHSLRVHNHYGPSETHVVITNIIDKDQDIPSLPPIGKPIDNTSVYIVDENNKILPVGVVGELCISGDSLGLGYLNKNELTNKKFVINPFAKKETKMYKTGDLARWLPSGVVEFIGRIDSQVKVRGFRVELKEIESNLQEYRDMKEAVVIAMKDASEDTFLCAYYVADNEINTEQLRIDLTTSLPSYMIPTSYIHLDKIPLNHNGKVDHKALPQPNKSTFNIAILPADKIEKQLALIWQEVLGIDQFDRTSNFFELGGHSLKIMTMSSKIHKLLDIKVPVKVLFERPTIGDIAEYIRSTDKDKYYAIQSAAVKEYYPMSPAQKRLYILDQMEGVGTAYNMMAYMYIHGDLEYKRFEQAFEGLIQRHDTLRTSFGVVDGELVQKVHDKVNFSIEYINNYSSDIDELKNGFIKKFDLSKAPLLRVALIKISKQKHLLMFDMHHIISDGTSMNILIKELTMLYKGEELDKLKIQYKDYSVWQKDMYVGERMASQEKFWLDAFKDDIPVLNLPLDYQRPSLQSFDGDSINFSISNELKDRINSVAVNNGATLYMMLLASFNILLAKYSGQEDIIIGSPIVGRPHDDLKNIIGMFVNTLAMRNYPSREKSFKDFLAEVRVNALKAYENQDYQFEELVDKLDIKRDMSRNTLFDVMFVLQNMEMGDIEIDGLLFQNEDSMMNISKFDLNLNAVETKKGILFNLEYCTKLFERETIERLIKHYTTILDQTTKDAYIKIKEIDIITELERNLIINNFNNTDYRYPHKTLQELFECQVQQTPNKIAVSMNSEKLTYRELNEKANIIANDLRSKGIDNTNVVGILVERSIEMIVGLIGILKSGAGCLPISTKYPSTRVKYMIQDSNARFILVTSKYKEILKEEDYINEEQLIDISTMNSMQQNNNPLMLNEQDDLLYLVYTSGTTGNPKGVMVGQRVIINLAYFDLKNTSMDFSDRVLQYSNVGFDAIYQEMYSAFLAGGELCVVDEETKDDLVKLLNYIQNNQIKTADLPAALIKFIFNNEIYSKKFPKSLNDIIVTGEQVIIPPLLKEHMKNHKLNIHNHYGPSETHVVTTYSQGYEGDIPTLPYIGKPINNTRAYIVDKENQITPIGIFGELCIAGDSLGIGYLGRDDLTAEKFVDNPFEQGSRMYRTGDLARWLPDGNIEFIGRIDHQVKIRGFRVELGEIEGRLLEHSSVREALVIAIEDSQGVKYLCAYVVIEDSITISDIREYLAKDLPDYMIPSYFVKLDKMPINHSGKINRKALPKPESNMQTGKNYVPPSTSLEKKLVGIWSEILGVEKIGIEDNFFELGGHSLKATALVTIIHSELDVEITLKEVFKTPTIAEIAQIIEGANSSNCTTIKPCVTKEYYPLSSAQNRLYILNELENIGTAYNMPVVMKIEGDLDVTKLERCFKTLILRHDSLRTAFKVVDGIPMQKIREEVDFNIEYYEDLDQGIALENLKSMITPFNLSEDCLMRVFIDKISENSFIMLFDMHHIISDGVSMSILINELTQLYDGNSLPELIIQYKDYSNWQNEYLTSKELEKQEEFWLENLKGELPILNMPLDHQRPIVQKFDGDDVKGLIEKQLKDKLNSLSISTGSTLYMTLLACFNVLLSKYSGQEDILIGSPIAGRSQKELRSVIGIFINTLVMRNYPKKNISFREFLSDVKNRSLRAYENQDYQFEDLVQKLDIKRDTSRNPIFDIMFVLQNTGIKDIEIENLKFNSLETGVRETKFDLALNAIETKDSIILNFEYCSNIFDKKSIERLVSHYITIVEAVVDNIDVSIKDISMLSTAERVVLLENFNDTKVRYPEDKTICELFEKQVEETPNNVAIEYGDEKLTYKELNEKSNQLARYLRKKGILSESRVALLISPSLEMIISILAVLKAGGVYLPIDKNNPAERIEYILKDSESELILTDDDKYRSVSMDAFNICSKESNVESSDNLDRINNSRNAAYIIYTSGTTGKPKGVIVEHRSLVNNVCWRKRECDINKLDCTIQVFSYAFDGFVASFFTPIISGSKMLILNDDDRKDCNLIANIIKNKGITYITAVPSLYSTLLQCIDDNALKKLRFVLLAGEKTPELTVRTSKKRAPNLEIINEYGPTESTITATMQRNMRDQSNSIIGSVIDNTDVYILSDDQLQAIGIPGELCIGGVGVARGYLNKPELTERKFVVSPFNPRERIFRTGDVARWKADGTIEFLGRVDHQVKIRGYRVEVGEIENKLLQHELVQQSVVTVKASEQGNDYLCAHIVGAKELSISSLRKYLADKLPEYMMPSYFILMKELPLNKNGKVDINKLMDLDVKMHTGVEYTAPIDNIESKLVDIWKEVLSIDLIGTRNNFFELGGHSLKAATLATKIHKEFNVEIALKDIFKSPTIEELGNYIKASEGSIYSSIVPIEKKPYYPMSPAQKRLYVLDQIEGVGSAYNMPTAMSVKGKVDIYKFEDSINKLISNHESLRTSFEMIDGQLVQIIHEDIEFKMDYIKIKSQEIYNSINNFIRPFDLSMNHLVRIGIFEIDVDEYILVFDIHHIVCDGVSMNILIQELMRIYNNENVYNAKLQYKDYSVWKNAIYQDERIVKQEQYWLDIFDGELPVLNMPTDFVRPIMQSFEGDSVGFDISKELMNNLQEIARDSGVTMYMLLLAVLNILISKYSGQEDIIIASPVAGRVHEDLSNIIGMFVNTIAMRNFPHGSKTFSDFLSEVKNNALGAYDNQDYQFEDLIENLNIKRDLSRNALFDIMFVLQNMKVEDFEIDGVEFEPYKLNTGISKFDLTLHAIESDSGISFSIEYSTKLYKKTTIEIMTKHYVRILDQIVTNAKTRIMDISLLSNFESREYIYSFNNTDSYKLKSETIQELFVKQVNRTPEKQAIVHGDKHITYKELDERSNQLARLLKKKNIGKDKIVALLMRRSIDTIVAVLGVLKAGGAYLPIDYSYPKGRKEYMLSDSKSQLLLVDSNVEDIEYDKDIVDVTNEEIYMNQNKEPIDNINSSSDLAYMIYTSGSTGKPKGTMLEHKSVVNYILWASKSYLQGEALDFAFHTTLAFDLTVTSIYLPLITGNKIIVYSQYDNELTINRVFDDNKAKIVKLTPAHMRVIQDRDNSNSSVKRLIVGGEQLDVNLARTVFESFNRDVEIFNEYGPTEATVGCMIHKYNNDNDNDIAVPIGIPADNLLIYLLDNYLKPVATNIEGEMYISGAGVARGYYNNEELTASKFLEDPFNIDMRMYKTGDIAKRLSNGLIQYVGRSDEQVKVRGYRVEIGEIEDKLYAYELIEEVIVIAREDDSNGKYLCAYFVGKKDIKIATIRSYLLEELPEYMVPAYFIQVPSMPLTNNGKIDKALLPMPEDNYDTGGEYIDPTNDKEEIMAKIWGEVLRVKRVGINDNFFSLGGDSIKAIQVLSRLNNYGYKLEMKDLFRYPVISELSIYIKETSREINQELVEGYVKLTPIQKKFFEQGFIEKNHYNQAVMIYRADRFDELYVGETLKNIIKHHDALRIVYETSDSGIRQFNRNLVDDIYALHVHDLTMESNYEEIIENRVDVIQGSIDLEKGPLVLCNIFRTKDGDHMLLVIHHLVVDGISWRIILEDFTTGYIQLTNDEQIKFPYKTNSFKDWSNKLHMYANSEELLKERKYWNDIAQTHVQSLPKEKSDMYRKVKNSSSVQVKLSQDDTNNLLTRVNEAYNTEINDILLATLGATLSKWANINSILINMEGHGREGIIKDADISRTIGWFTSEYPVVLDTQYSMDLGYHIKTVKENLRRIPNNGVGFGILKYLSFNQDIDLDLNIKPEINFNYLGQFDGDVDVDLFEISEISTGSAISPNYNKDYPLDINGIVIKQELTLTFSYDRYEFEEDTISSMADIMKKTIIDIIDHCINKDHTEVTPSDFSMDDIGFEDLDYILGELS